MDACKGGDASGGEPARSHDDGPEPKGVPPTAASGPAEAGRKRMNRSFGSAAFWSIMLGILGFVPAYAVFMVDGGWYLDAFLRRNPEDAVEAEHMWGGVWMAGIGIHAITGIGWTLAAFHQVITGATGPPGGRHKALHRRAGYPAALLGLFVAAEALVLQCLKPFTLSNYTPIVVNGALIILNLVVGIRHVQKKRYAEHKVAMAWTCAWTSAPGGVRVAIYLFNISGDCPKIASHGTRSYGMVTLDVLLVLVPVAIVSCAMGRSRSWIFAKLDNSPAGSCQIILPQKQLKRENDIYIMMVSWEHQVFVTASYDPTSHFEEASTEVLSLWHKITGAPLDLTYEPDPDDDM